MLTTIKMDGSRNESRVMIMASLLHFSRDGQLVFLSENERATLAHCNPCTEQSYSDLLSKLSATDISTVYRLGMNPLEPAGTCSDTEMMIMMMMIFSWFTVACSPVRFQQTAFCFSADRLDKSDFTYIKNQPKEGTGNSFEFFDVSDVYFFKYVHAIYPIPLAKWFFNI